MASSAADRNEETIDKNRRAIRIWLGFVVFALFCLVLVGGATRLTESGLSITQWKPIHGVIPPLSVEEWQEEFKLYQQIPEYQQINAGMTLDEFKGIFWWEWAHRLLARSIGVIFAVPLFYFWVTGRVEKRLRLPLLGIFALGGFQGFVGWWMVSSGLVDRTDVSQYRLATHLVIACLIFSACIWIMRGLTPHSPDVPPKGGARFAAIVAFLALFQIYLGALVAGLDAGLTYNTWPLMDGSIIPGGLFVQNPAWINLFENPKTVQFVHRCGAYLLFAVALAQMIWLFKVSRGSTHCRRGVVFFVLVFIQAGLGVATLLTHVDLHTALTHQGGALVVLGFAIAHWRGFIGAYPRSQVS
ncbi:COX15/CtaA family protein [Rhizobium sp. L1K21]|uniref:COX15/CtaA family protein n=1 Tax=Rhizobium sp. L1K21 TaxID=2954933 RepID=UPI002093904A|nr:COX15/CtaA family protein [Rhizobium sp. L1K21]MCO6185845.1 COX15/CtaA family protein [Rhizobium sp. L1K21]